MYQPRLFTVLVPQHKETHSTETPFTGDNVNATAVDLAGGTPVARSKEAATCAVSLPPAPPPPHPHAMPGAVGSFLKARAGGGGGDSVLATPLCKRQAAPLLSPPAPLEL